MMRFDTGDIGASMNEVAAYGTAVISARSKTMTNSEQDFKTHIKEPRWQQVASVIVAVVLIALWFWFARH